MSNYAQFSDLFKVAMENSCKEFNWRPWVEEILATAKFKDIQETITNSLIECRSLCPFCREPCQLTAGEHEHYCGSFHRPKGINGWHRIDSEEITIEECTKSILLNHKFLYKNVLYNYSDYKTVDEIFKSWNILSQDSIESKYWQWVLHTFQKNFVDYHGVKQNDKINQNWSGLTAEEVIDDIEKHYQNYIFKTTI